MKISVKNLGPLKQAEFTLGDLTIICGENNTGKTYATYALFGFLSFWRDRFFINVSDEDIQHLLNEGIVELDINSFIDKAQAILEKACNAYKKHLPDIFASSDRYFAESHFSITLDSGDIQPMPTFEFTTGAANKQLFSISKKTNSPSLTVSLLVEKENVNIPRDNIGVMIGFALKDVIFGHLFPGSFIASAERTGAVIFRKEFNSIHNSMFGEFKRVVRGFNPKEEKVYKKYTVPTQSNIDFMHSLEAVARNESFIAREHPDILGEFSDIIGGSYRIAEPDMLYFIPKGKNIKLTMGASSSSVRSLLATAFYLGHVAAEGDLLIIDEPELNLHPENQRRLARLFSRLVNIGIKVFITTHSDYIVKELNTLVMLNQDDERLEELATREGYKPSELLNPDRVKVYMAQDNTLVPADIDEQYGIEAPSFDKTINDMNRIQDKIVWGGDE